MIEPLENRTFLAATRIMPLGDSITASFTGYDSYRYLLWKDLQSGGYSNIDFVGSQFGVSNGAPLHTDFDQNHEGHSGWRADEILSNLPGWANTYKPDVVLLHLGTNDLSQGQSVSSTITDLGSIIDTLRQANANVTVLLAQIIPNNATPTQVQQLNAQIPTLAAQKNTAQSRVITVDEWTGFNVSTDTFDGIHPNATGEQKMSAKWYSALTTVLAPSAPPPPPAGTFLSDLTPTYQANGWGPYEKDASNGEAYPGDGHTLTLNGSIYAKGLGVHAGSELRFNLAGQFSSFQADIGVDDEVGNNGSVVFQLFDNLGNKLFDSGKLTGVSATQSINVNVTGKSELRLVVTNAGDGANFDHADWAWARLQQSVPDPAPSTTYVSDIIPTFQANGWGPVEKDMSNGEVAAGDGKPIKVASVAYARGLGVHAASELRYNLAKQYARFKAMVGVDDETGGNGSVQFLVYGDGAFLFDSGVMRCNQAAKLCDVDVSNVSELKLVVNNGGDNNNYDHADWADAKLIKNQPAGLAVNPFVGATINAGGTFSAGGSFADSGAGPWTATVDYGDGTGAAALTLNSDKAFSLSHIYLSSGSFVATVTVNNGSTTASNSATVKVNSIAPVTYLSDLNPTFSSNGWGNYERDLSNGEQAAGDGHIISVGGVQYAKGLGAHAASEIRYDLSGGSFTHFQSDVGIDDEEAGLGSVRFMVYLDGVLAYDSNTVHAGAAKVIDLNVTGKTQLKLVVTDAGDGNYFDHADWANARLTV